MEKTERQINTVWCPGGSVVCRVLEYAFEQWYWLPESDAASKGSDLLLSPWDGRLSIMIDLIPV